MRVSVVVCAYTIEMYDHVRDAVDAVLEQTYDDVELVVIADGDRTLYESVRSEYGDRDDVRLGYNEQNRGLSYSRNYGIELASGEVVAFLDDDAVPERDWIETLVDGYRRHDALAVGGKMTPIWTAGKPEQLPPEFYWLVGVTPRGFPESECEVRNTFGSNISFRANVLEELDGFDVDLGRKGDAQIQGEETELAVRMHDRYGERVWYLPDARVGHKVFRYRTRRQWLLKRAFWQGYSKRKMSEHIDDAGGQESAFLRTLAFESVPRRLRELLAAPSRTSLHQFVMLFVLTAAVGAGFAYGVVS